MCDLHEKWCSQMWQKWKTSRKCMCVVVKQSEMCVCVFAMVRFDAMRCDCFEMRLNGLWSYTEQYSPCMHACMQISIYSKNWINSRFGCRMLFVVWRVASLSVCVCVWAKCCFLSLFPFIFASTSFCSASQSFFFFFFSALSLCESIETHKTSDGFMRGRYCRDYPWNEYLFISIFYIESWKVNVNK